MARRRRAISYVVGGNAEVFTPQGGEKLFGCGQRCIKKSPDRDPGIFYTFGPFGLSAWARRER